MSTPSKYLLTSESITREDGDRLYRIRALRSFNDVLEGELGGWVGCHANLSHDGDCWVYGNAKAYGGARVTADSNVRGLAEVRGNAVISGRAKINGKSVISGNASVMGEAWVGESARVFGEAIVSGSAILDGNASVSDYAHVGGDTELSGGRIRDAYRTSEPLTATQASSLMESTFGEGSERAPFGGGTVTESIDENGDKFWTLTADRDDTYSEYGGGVSPIDAFKKGGSLPLKTKILSLESENLALTKELEEVKTKLQSYEAAIPKHTKRKVR